jgi:hypothetical protein
VTELASTFAEEHLLSSGGVSLDCFLLPGRGQGSQIGNHLPKFLSTHAKARHLSSRNTIANGLKQLPIFAAVAELARRQSWSSASASVATMANLAGIDVGPLAGLSCRSIPCEGILLSHRRMLRQ